MASVGENDHRRRTGKDARKWLRHIAQAANYLSEPGAPLWIMTEPPINERDVLGEFAPEPRGRGHAPRKERNVVDLCSRCRARLVGAWQVVMRVVKECLTTHPAELLDVDGEAYE